jgi:hypothetical protein
MHMNYDTDTGQMYLNLDSIPIGKFGGWIYAEQGQDGHFPFFFDNDLPEIVAKRKLVRVGFLPLSHTLRDNSSIIYDGVTFRVYTIEVEDFVDHKVKKRGKTKGWILIRWDSSKHSGSEKSANA